MQKKYVKEKLKDMVTHHIYDAHVQDDIIHFVKHMLPRYIPNLQSTK